jgi:hypothetical protein
MAVLPMTMSLTDPETPDTDEARYAVLLAAARAWRTSLIPRTSTGLQPQTSALVAAVAAFDPEPCQHERFGRVFFADSPRQECSDCGQPITPTTT